MSLPTPAAAGVFADPHTQSIEAFLFKGASGRRPAKWQESWQWEMSCAHIVCLDLIKRAYLVRCGCSMSSRADGRSSRRGQRRTTTWPLSWVSHRSLCTR